MKYRNLLLTVILALSQACVHPVQEITTLILVRHAEKADDGTEDSPLTAEGEERATALLNLLKETAVDAIYSTPYKRTRETVAPIAAQKNIQIQEYKAFETKDIEQMIEKHRGGTIVIVGHSDSIPWTADLLTGKEIYSKWRDNDYDNVLVVDVIEKGKTAKVTWLNYGL
jgi:broad specificity phosphatase PhoE